MSESTLRKLKTGAFSDLLFPGHATAEDYDREAGESGACVAEADASLAYRSTFYAFHTAFVPIMEKKTGIKREVNESATSKAKARSDKPDSVKDILESFNSYSKRVKANVPDETWAELEEDAKAVALQTKIDASPSTRTGPVNKLFLAKANEILARPDEARDETIQKLLSAVSDFELIYDESDLPVAASLARLCEAFALRGI